MTPALLEAIMRHVGAQAPNEACGLLVGHGGAAEYIPCRNEHYDPANCFAIAPEDWVSAEERGRVLAVVHSHTSEPYEFSEVSESKMDDRSQMNTSGLPWYLFTDDGGWSRHTPEGWSIFGHSFVEGVQDCYTLVRDYYDLPDFSRYFGFWRERDLFGEGISAAGFRTVGVGDHLPGDVVLFNVYGGFADHCGILLGDGMVAHHTFGHVSAVSPKGSLVEKIHSIARKIC